MQLAGQLSPLIEQVPELGEYKVRLDRLAQEIAAKDWTLRDVEAAKHELGEASPQWPSSRTNGCYYCCNPCHTS